MIPRANLLPVYEPHAFLNQVNDNALPILLICACSMLANYTLFIESFRVSRRLKTVTMPVFCTYPVWGLATMAKRRSVRGFTPLRPGALTVMCLTWFTASIGWFGPEFRTWPWVLLAVLSTGSAAFMTWIAVRFREPEQAAMSLSPEAVPAAT